MPRIRLIHIVLAIVLGLVAIFLIRVHGAAGQSVAARGDAESGRLYAQNWCTECHSVELETAGTGRFAPDFTTRMKTLCLNHLPNFHFPVLADARCWPMSPYTVTWSRASVGSSGGFSAICAISDRVA